MMNRRERFVRALRCEEVDRIPFWVKVFGPSYLQFQEPRWRDMGELELADLLELDHMAGGPVPVRGRNDNVTQRQERTGDTSTTWLDTPDGVLRSASAFDASSHSWHPTEFPVKTRNDLRALRHRYAHTEYEFVPEMLDGIRARVKQVGDRGIVFCGMGISPLMDLIQHLIGPAQTYYFLADFPDDMDELIELMHQDNLRRLRAIVEHAPYDYVMSVENTSTTLLSPKVFEQYPLRHLRDYAEVITSRGKSHIIHMCGKLKALLPKIDELPSLSIEAFTSPLVGDTTLADRAALCPSISVIGGTNATLWLRPAEEICRQIEADLDAAGGMRGVVLTCAGVMPPATSIDKIAKVRAFAKTLTWRGN